MSEYLTVEATPDALKIGIMNDWLFPNVSLLQAELEPVPGGEHKKVIFACDGLQDFDLAGAWVLYRKSMDFQEEGRHTEFVGFKAAHFKFLKHIIDLASEGEEVPDYYQVSKEPNLFGKQLEQLGQTTADGFESFGYIARSILDGFKNPSRLVIAETIRQVYETGVRAIPIVMVICFLMGVVLAYQAAGQLEKFGVTIYVVDLVSNSVLREIGVLLGAIMVAGRSGSAFAAALGTMKLNEEVDALQIMGLNPNQILIIPRVLGLVIAMPLLTVFADIAGLAGGAAISTLVLDISFVQFVERVALSTRPVDLAVGLMKAPVFAFLIAATGTLRGMQVTGSAEELGRLTTVAVVQSIFLIIISDAFATILFSRLGI
jgi:phospholipid/cholesterol/gamma-HCH transport system permease protein